MGDNQAGRQIDVLSLTPEYLEATRIIMGYVDPSDVVAFSVHLARLVMLAIDHGIAVAQKRD